MILKLLLDLPDENGLITLARKLGKTTLQHMQVSQIDVEDTETIIDELASNVMRHAASDHGRFVLMLEYHADRVVITVKDNGCGFAFADVPPPGTLRPDFDGERIGGFGLKIVGGLSDRLRFYRADGGTTVRAEKRLKYEPGATARKTMKMEDQSGIAASNT